MPKRKKEKELLQTLEKSSKKPEAIYTEGMINYTSKTFDTKKYCTEVIAEQILKEHIDYSKEPIIKNIFKIKRESNNKSYYIDSHNKIIVKDTNRKEENLIKNLCKLCKINEKLGFAIDYQVPLKDKRIDKVGKIDLVTYKEDSNELFIVEAKNEKSPETLLRCCLEIQTYYQIIDKDKLIKDFIKAKKIKKENPILRKAILIFEDSNPAKEYNEKKERTYINKLLKLFNIEIVII